MNQKEQLIEYWKISRLIKDEKLLKAFKKIKRENFVLDDEKYNAYLDVALPIIERQTISQPSTVMIMLQALELKKRDKVLEVGSGSGYNAALIAELVKPSIVYSTEILLKLVNFAKKNLKKESIKNVKIILTDGSKGYKNMKFDKIIVTAACKELPEKLVNSLKDNGILIAPIGPSYVQEMIKIKKVKGKLFRENLGEFLFVPLKHEDEI